MASTLQVRLAFAVPAIAATIGVLWLGGWALAGALAVLGALGTWEVYQLARRQAIDALVEVGCATAAVIPLATWAASARAVPATPAALYAGVLWMLGVLAAAMILRGPSRRPLAAVAVTGFGALYASAPLAVLLAVRHGVNSEREPVAYFLLALVPLVLTWICDTAAFATGSALGGRKLAPALSPNKTWSGAVGGLLGALGFAIVLGTLVLNRAGWRFGVWQLVGLGLAVGIIGQVGDLAESLLKREAGVKDSSALFPGHGGVLDRLDSLYFVIPASAALFELYGII